MSRSGFTAALVLSLLSLGSSASGQILRERKKPPPPHKPAEKKQPTQVVVQTLPNAQVYLDDAFKGQASSEGRLLIDNAEPGEHKLRVSLPGRRDYGQQVKVVAGQVATVNATLAQLPAQIVVESSPNAQVYLDDVFKGQASPEGRLVIDDSQPGAHKVRVSLAGKKDYLQEVTAVAGQTVTVNAALSDLAGRLVVRSAPGAEVFLDGSKRGAVGEDGEVTLGEVAAGAHELRVTARGKKEYRQQITVAAGEQAAVEAGLADLAPARGTGQENVKDGLKYVYIPPGSFMMGCSPGDSECYPDEKPAHQVSITKGFWMGQTEVTVGAYKRFVASAGREIPSAPPFNSGWANENQPIVNVSWDDAQAYCTWAGGRLPTEAEWEYAGRGGSSEARYGPLDDVAWYSQNRPSRAHDVAQKRPNALGLYDILGNVWEWVNDWYDGNYYGSSPGTDPSGSSSGSMRVLRGGSWFDLAGLARVSYRDRYFPSFRYDYVGLRCVREVAER